MTELLKGVRAATHGDQSPSGPPAAEPTPDEQRRRLAQLGLAVLAAVLVAWRSGHLAAFAVVLALVAMIMLHELGHFLTAKWAGMKVTEFFFGFGPRLWSVRRGETEYGIKAVPAGGYVRILGMHNLEPVDPADESRTYRQQSYWRRMSVAVAGSTMHFVIAFLLFMVIFTGTGVPRPSPEPVIGRVAEESPAARAGFREGDRLVALAGQPVDDWGELVTLIRGRPGKRLVVTVVRAGRRLAIPVVPKRVERDGRAIGQIGVTNSVEYERRNPVAAVGRSGAELGRAMWTSVRALGSFFTPSSLRDYADLVLGREPRAADGERTPAEEKRFLSPVGFGRLASQAAQQGVFEVLFLLVLINVFVGIFNLVPLLPFDGGHVAIATYEAIRSRWAGRRYYADVSRLLPLTMTVVFLLVIIGVTSLKIDLIDPLANPFK